MDLLIYACISNLHLSRSVWRNRDEFFQGREAIKAFLRRKWAKELEYCLMKGTRPLRKSIHQS